MSSTTTRSEADELDELASRLNRCSPSRVDPERFHVERDDIVRAMRRLARQLARQPKPTTTTWRPDGQRR